MLTWRAVPSLEDFRKARGLVAVRTRLKKKPLFSIRNLGVLACLVVAVAMLPSLARGWNEDEFEHRPLFAYPAPQGRDNIIGNLVEYQIQKGDTLLDVGRWYGLSAKEISDANNHKDWWSPPVGTKVILTDEHILPDTPHVGLVLNIPEMRLYYYYPSPTTGPSPHHGKMKKAAAGGFKKVVDTEIIEDPPDEPAPEAAPSPDAAIDSEPPAPPDEDSDTAATTVSKPHPHKHHAVAAGSTAEVVYTFPVGLGRFDWKTPVGAFRVTAKVKDPTWVLPDDIYKEHLERDGEAEHVIPGGDDDNPLGHYKLDLSIPEYGIHGTNVPWGVGMEVSHGCIRLYPEDIDRLFHKTKVGTPGAIVYQPIKFGWRGDALYVEVHTDLYGKYPGLWSLARDLVQQKDLEDSIDWKKLENAVVAQNGIPTYVMPGPAPDDSGLTASYNAP
jgi:lipoprotein-anchoring transpeptidase ErfK/SrfK